jgi:hypothetical protein
MKNYEAGKLVESMSEFCWLCENNTLLFVKNWQKTASTAFFVGMPFRTVENFIKANQIYVAKKIKHPT